MSSEGKLGEMWYLSALLPNLRLKDPIGNEAMSMVPYEDTRLQGMANADARLGTLLERFTDQFGRKRHPSAIISRSSTAPLPGENLVDFRNAVAIACVVGGAQHQLLVAPAIGHSDYFDLYPVFLPSDSSRVLLIDSYVGVGSDDGLERFRGQTSPALHNVEARVPIADPFLLDALMAEWNALYVDGRPVDNRVVGLFRSLQVAYHAAAMPTKNHASLHDFGISVSHWVSAMEILLHPEKGDVNERHVLDVLSDYPWRMPTLVRTLATLPANSRHEATPLNAVQLLYHQLYKTRNDFIHGNDLNNAPYHFPFQNMRGPNWLGVAPLVFKAALSCFFGQYEKSGLFENALAAILTGSPAQGAEP